MAPAPLCPAVRALPGGAHLGPVRAGLIGDVLPVKELVDRIISEAQSIIRSRLAAMVA